MLFLPIYHSHAPTHCSKVAPNSSTLSSTMASNIALVGSESPDPHVHNTTHDDEADLADMNQASITDVSYHRHFPELVLKGRSFRIMTQIPLWEMNAGMWLGQNQMTFD